MQISFHINNIRVAYEFPRIDIIKSGTKQLSPGKTAGAFLLESILYIDTRNNSFRWKTLRKKAESKSSIMNTLHKFGRGGKHYLPRQ